jgi:three-Cys-motif partner protein
VASNFFESPQAAAKLKHELLASYLRPFVQKLGSTSPGKRVVYLDAFAGPGAYDDDTPGSPALALQVAEQVSGVDDLVGFFVEADRANYQKLHALISVRRPDWRVLHGPIKNHLPTILREAGELPMFAFLDPFGLGVSYEDLCTILGRSPAPDGRRPRAATEVLFNFSYSGLRRGAGQLTSESTDPTYLKAQATIIGQMNDRLGGDWWQPIWESGEADRKEQILHAYIDMLRRLPGAWNVFAVPVTRRWQGKPVYYLLHLSQHRDGMWLFYQSLSGALEKFRNYCIEEAGQFELEPLADREKAWFGQIAANIERLLTASGDFVVEDRMEDVYGTTLGFAREKHVKSAIKALHKRGVTPTTGIGTIQTMAVETWPPGVSRPVPRPEEPAPLRLF